MFVIMGATGQVGGSALETLKQRGAEVRAVSRDPARAGGLGVETVRGDASDTASLVSAFKGAEAVFVLLVPPAMAEDVLAESRAAAQSIAEAVREAMVPHLVGTDYAEKLADLDEAFNAGRLAFPANSGELRRGTITLDAVLQRLLGGAR